MVWGTIFFFGGFIFFFCVAVVLEIVREGFVSSATKTARACRAGQREMGITTSPEQTAVWTWGKISGKHWQSLYTWAHWQPWKNQKKEKE